jgi:Ca2+-binding RTX toxin-like protein
VDLWTGGLAEDHVNGGMVGQTFNLIIAHQFEALRDGDRLWYENQGFDAATLDAINHTTLSGLILRDTDTTSMQADAFVYFERHGGLASGGAAENPGSPQLVIGADGADTLVGGVAGDLLVAGLGNQVMTGGAGADTFIFGKAGISATITDFAAGRDHIEFDHLGGGQPSIRASGANTTIDFGGDHLTLLGVTPGQLHACDFIFNA